MPAIERCVIEAFEVGRTAWPGVQLAQEEFARRVKELQVTPAELATRASDLYLAWACAAQDKVALAHFETGFLGHVEGYIARLRLAADVVDEVRQELRIRLLAGPAPRVGEYGGRGALAAWVRIAAVRLALNWIKQNRPRALQTDDALDDVVGRGPSPEIATLKGRYADLFQEALERSLGTLDTRERTLMRLHFVDRLTIDAMGAIYRVHRATVARWLVDIRRKIFEQLRGELSLELKATSSEFQSILAVVQSELDLSVQRVLRSDG